MPGALYQCEECDAKFDKEGKLAFHSRTSLFHYKYLKKRQQGQDKAAVKHKLTDKAKKQNIPEASTKEKNEESGQLMVKPGTQPAEKVEIKEKSDVQRCNLCIFEARDEILLECHIEVAHSGTNEEESKNTFLRQTDTLVGKDNVKEIIESQDNQELELKNEQLKPKRNYGQQMRSRYGQSIDRVITTLVCFECKIKFFKRDLHLHERKFHNSRKYICEKCHLMPSKEKLRIHKIRVHYLRPKFNCKLCDDKYPFVREYYEHTKEKHGGRNPCPECDYISTYPKGLRNHINSKH